MAVNSPTPTSVEELAQAVTSGEADLSALEGLRVELMFSLPLGMKSRIEALAKEHNTTTSLYVRRTLADAIGYKLPATAGKARTTGLSVDEKKRIQADKDKKKRDLVKSLQAMYRAGTISEDEEDDEEDDA